MLMQTILWTIIAGGASIIEMGYDSMSMVPMIEMLERNKMPAPFSEPPIFIDIIEAALETESLSYLVDVIMAANLINLFSNEELEVTIFAPTNDAYEAALKQHNMTFFELAEDEEMLSAVLYYHVVPVVAMSTDLIDGMSLTTLNPSANLTVNLDMDGVAIGGDNNFANVVVPDIVAGMAVVHIIDAVLLPVFL
eukprot:TRINITY_DN2826_c0_g2_i1.p2 TRINITY_DN2826_c0_g2~~TRINITY_DN2826_c0_g2_i1.p2  ORF type:complete len:194 (+),score=28.07 TRINITY_DN2826_c0_g2_i1:212-793(+)